MIGNQSSGGAVLITDADNTLWDTNQVFAEAQLQLLSAVERYAGRVSQKADRLALVRRHDQALARRDHRGLKYDPVLLVREVWRVVAGDSVPPIDDKIANEIASEFMDNLRIRPRLRQGVCEAIAVMSENDVRIWVVSEGSRERVLEALAAYDIERTVSRLLIAEKTTSLYNRLRKLVPSTSKVVAVGDQLDRDIEPAKNAGLQTAYFPGGFTPVWTDESKLKYADAVIDDYRQLLPMLSVRAAA